jgi:hypothetical protein
MIFETQQDGRFTAKYVPWHGWPPLRPNDFPIFLRAFKRDDPFTAAWTIIRHPFAFYWDAKTPYKRTGLRGLDTWLAKLRMLEYPLVEEGSAGKLVIHNENGLPRIISGDPGKVLADADYDPNDDDDFIAHAKVVDVVLVLGPASVITGRVTDASDKPIANAIVRIEEMEIETGDNTITIEDLGRDNKKSWVFAVTDSDGRYRLNNLPASWKQVQLEVAARGFEGGELRLRGPGGGRIPDEPQVIDNCDVQLFRE